MLITSQQFLINRAGSHFLKLIGKMSFGLCARESQAGLTCPDTAGWQTYVVTLPQATTWHLSHTRGSNQWEGWAGTKLMT